MSDFNESKPVEYVSVVSSNIDSVGYDEENEIMYIRFKSGSEYSYTRVPVKLYEGLINAPSKGKFFARFIKNRGDIIYNKIS